MDTRLDRKLQLASLRDMTTTRALADFDNHKLIAAQLEMFFVCVACLCRPMQRIKVVYSYNLCENVHSGHFGDNREGLCSGGGGLCLILCMCIFILFLYNCIYT